MSLIQDFFTFWYPPHGSPIGMIASAITLVLLGLVLATVDYIKNGMYPEADVMFASVIVILVISLALPILVCAIPLVPIIYTYCKIVKYARYKYAEKHYNGPDHP